MRTGSGVVAALLMLIAGTLSAAGLEVGPVGGGSLTATFKQAGVAVESPFTRFSGSIDYDPGKVAAAVALIEVETASLDIGDPAFNAELAKKSWFDSAAHPIAVFRSTAIKPLAANRFEAVGTLAIKGRTQTIVVPVIVSQKPAGTVFDGTFSISRKAFGIGDPLWDEVLEDQVIVKFHLVAGR